MFDEELSAIPVQPPRTGMLRGMRLRGALPRTTLLLLLAFLALFALMPLSIVSSDPQMKLSLGPSRTAEGHVLSAGDRLPGSSCGNSSAHQVVYAFPTDSGKEFRGAIVLCAGSPYYSVQSGDKIEVRYLVRDPAVNAVAGSGSEPPIFVFLIFPIFFLLFLSPLFLPQVRDVLRARRLYRSAPLAQGQVIFIKRRGFTSWPGWPGSVSADVFVSHRQVDGSQAETVVSCMNEWLINQLSPGSPVRILPPLRKGDRGVLLEAYIR